MNRTGPADGEFSVRVTKDHLVFSAAHFITFNGNICERLHGHNWRVAVEVFGPLDENRYVFDFIALRDAVQSLTAELDHRVLLPERHGTISVAVEDDEVTARFENRRWVFPCEDCIILPVVNTTAEEIAHWMTGRLLPVVQSQDSQVHALQVEVEENFGQWARCRVPVMND